MVLTTAAFFKPSQTKIKASFALVLTTLTTGTIIIVKDHVSILSVCLSGLLYIGFNLAGLVYATHKLARQTYIQKDRLPK
jgi:hypothetical protein